MDQNLYRPKLNWTKVFTRSKLLLLLHNLIRTKVNWWMMTVGFIMVKVIIMATKIQMMTKMVVVKSGEQLHTSGLILLGRQELQCLG